MAAIAIDLMLMDSDNETPAAACLEPEFTVTFNVTSEAGSYNSFIQGLRRRLESGSYAGNVRMLNPEEDGRNKWFDVVLKNGNSQITVRIRYGDLYLTAFQGANGQWYEFRPQSNTPTPFFCDTAILPYTSDYPNNRGASLSRDTSVGANSLDRAISSLADPNFNPGNWDNRQYLINLMIMFPEAIRYTAVSDFVYPRMHDPSTPDSPINDTIDHLIHNWGSLSMEMRRSDCFGSFREFAECQITSREDAELKLGLLLCSTKTPTEPRLPRSLPDHTVSDMNTVKSDEGRQLVEIFGVMLLDTKNGALDLYGDIQVVDGLSTPQYIFHRTKNDTLRISPKEYIPLAGPTRAISAFDSFYIDVFLWDYYSWWPTDDEVSNGQITWNYFADNVYNQPLREEVKGEYGSIAVRYAVYNNAVTATVQVKLINGDDENPAKVYGEIDAWNTLSNIPITLKYYTEDYVDIKPQQQIPLLRSVVVVPLNSSIIVYADLWSHNWILPDRQIAKGTITFEPDTSKPSTGIIWADYGKVEVMVTWSSSWD